MTPEYRRYDRHEKHRTYAERPMVKNNDAIVVSYKGKKIPAKVSAVIGTKVEATANGKKYMCERMGGEFVASGML